MDAFQYIFHTIVAQYPYTTHFYSTWPQLSFAYKCVEIIWQYCGVYALIWHGHGHCWCVVVFFHGPLTRYVQLRVAHAPGMPRTFSPPPPSKKPRVSDPAMHHGTCVTARAIMHAGIANPRWREEHSKRMRNSQFYVSGKRPMCDLGWWPINPSVNWALIGWLID